MSERDPSSTSDFGRFLVELKRRHVVRAALAYAAVVFVVLQTAEIVLPAFLLGPEADGALRVLVVAFVLLFPVVIALAWVYEITPQGIRSMAALDAERGRVEEGRLLPRLAFLAVTIVAAGGAGLWWYRTDTDTVAERSLRQGPGDAAFVSATTTDPSGPIRSLAVLPLENFSPEAEGEQDYFSAGMHEALVSQLSQMSAVRVISRTSAAQYDRSGKSVPQIGADLGVDAVVEGSVLRADGKVRITVQLIHAASDTHLWSRDYERDFADVIGLQREVAQAIADEIGTRLAERVAADASAEDRPVDRLSGADPDPSAAPVAGSGSRAVPAPPAAGPAPAAPEVQDAFLRGRYALGFEAPGNVELATDHFEHALRMDSAFTPALVGLAGARLVRGLAGDTESLGDLIEGRRLAASALRQDPESAEAKEVLASIDQAIAEYGHRIGEAAGEAARMRIVTVTGDSTVFVVGGDSVRVPSAGLMPMSTEFGSLMQVALARNDTEEDAAGAWLRGIWRLEAAGRPQVARQQAVRATERFPANEALLAELERLHALTGEPGRAVETRSRRAERFGDGPGPSADELTRRFRERGELGYWAWLLDDLRARRAAGQDVSWVLEAEALAALDRGDEAMAALERALRERDPRLASVRSGAIWDPLRTEERFRRLVEELSPGRAPHPRPIGG